MSVGAALAQAREERGLTVEQVSAATRIRAGLIRAIESDDFSGCGGAVYSRGHIRSIARAVGVDGEPLVAEFDREHLDEALPTVVPTVTVDADAAARADRRSPNWAAAMAVALVVICVLAAVSLVGNGGRSKPTAHDNPTVHVPTAAPSTQQTPAPPPASAVAQVPNATQAVALLRVNSSQTWLSVTTLSGRLLFQGLLASGQRKVFRDAKGLRLTIGNAPVVDLVANGQDVGAPRSEGNVAHITIARGADIQYG